MIATVTLNPCIDRTMFINAFTHGGINRATHTRQDIAGKGINVSVALQNLGQPSKCLGFNFTENGKLLEDGLNALGIPHDFIHVAGAVRTNIKILEQDTQIMTEVNMRGDYVPDSAITALLAKVAETDAELLILSGSLPQGVPTDIYRRMLACTRIPVLLDAEGECLRAGLQDTCRKPFLVKPNLYELESAYKVSLPTRQAIVTFCQDLIAQHTLQNDTNPESDGAIYPLHRAGLHMICVSMGKDGALLVGKDFAYHTPGLPLTVRGVQGAGDSLVAGMAMGLLRREPPDMLLRRAAATAAGSVIREGTLMCTQEDYQAMIQCVTAERIA